MKRQRPECGLPHERNNLVSHRPQLLVARSGARSSTMFMHALLDWYTWLRLLLKINFPFVVIRKAAYLLAIILFHGWLEAGCPRALVSASARPARYSCPLVTRPSSPPCTMLSFYLDIDRITGSGAERR
jgi:hypothetical protein